MGCIGRGAAGKKIAVAELVGTPAESSTPGGEIEIDRPMRVGDSRNKVIFVKLHTGGQYDETQNDNSIGIGRSGGRGKENKEHCLRGLRDLRSLHGVHGWHFCSAGALRGGAYGAAGRVAEDGDEYVRALRAEHFHGARMGTRH